MGYGIKISENGIVENCIDLGHDPVPEGYTYSDCTIGIGLNYEECVSGLLHTNIDDENNNTSQDVILTSQNGTQYRLIVSDAGVLSTVLVT